MGMLRRRCCGESDKEVHDKIYGARVSALFDFRILGLRVVALFTAAATAVATAIRV